MAEALRGPATVAARRLRVPGPGRRIEAAAVLSGARRSGDHRPASRRGRGTGPARVRAVVPRDARPTRRRGILGGDRGRVRGGDPRGAARRPTFPVRSLARRDHRLRDCAATRGAGRRDRARRGRRRSASDASPTANGGAAAAADRAAPSEEAGESTGTGRSSRRGFAGCSVGAVQPSSRRARRRTSPAPTSPRTTPPRWSGNGPTFPAPRRGRS